MSSHPAPAILCDNLVKIYKVADLEVVALQGDDLHVDPAEMIALVGASGSYCAAAFGLRVSAARRAVASVRVAATLRLVEADR